MCWVSDHVFPRLPVRQWVLSVTKRLRYFRQREGVALNMVLVVFLLVITQSLQTHSPGAANVPKATLHLAAVAFIHWFGSCMNEHVHFKLRGRWTAGLPGSGYSWSSATTEDLPDGSTGCLTAMGLKLPYKHPETCMLIGFAGLLGQQRNKTPLRR